MAGQSIPSPAASVGWTSVLARARNHWLLLTWVAALGWLDVVIHHDVMTVLLILGAGALVLFAGDVLVTIDRGGALSKLWRRVPAVARAYLLAAPFLAYSVLRGQGTGVEAALLALLASALMVFVLSATATTVDERVIGLYRVRDHVPRWARMVVLQAIAVLIGFGIVHGALDDIPALIGFPTLHSTYATAVPLQLAFAGLLSTTLGWFLFHRPTP